MLEKLKDIFLYSDSEPIIFSNFFFWGFFAVVLTIFSFIYKHKSTRNAWLFFASLFFYYKTSGLFITILLISTLTDFILGKKVFSSKSETSKKIFIATSIFINLFILVFFKYAYFFTDFINNSFGTTFEPINIFAEWTNQLTGSHFTVDKIILPVGISFYTFQTISYSIDIYRHKIKPVTNLLDFGFYVSFFPQLVAGPIVRASDFIPQLYQEFKLTKQEFGHAIFLILTGLTKKIVIGDYIAVNFIDRVFDNPLSYTGYENLMALYGYSLQVYADFSGYTDIAIGIALLMGFRLPINFNSPYKATNVGNFWKRWHISLSSWLQDYLYIPIGGNKKGSIFTYISITIILIFFIILVNWKYLPIIIGATALTLYVIAYFSSAFKNWINNNINILITMLLGGLWHGASWMFVIWGGLNGLGVIFYKLWRKISPWEGKKGLIFHFWAIFLTFNFITFTRIWFRGDSLETANNILFQISHNFNFNLIPEISLAFYKVFLLMIIGYTIHWLPTNFKEMYRGAFIKTPIWSKIIISTIVIFVLYQFHSADFQAFIYFQF